MNFNLVYHIETCYSFISQNRDFLSFVYYSHIPAVVISFAMGLLVFAKNRKSLVNQLLFGIVISFSLWVLLDLVIWNSYDSRLIMFAWSLLGILNVLFFILSLYFVYVFIDNSDIPFRKKIIFISLLMPVMAFTPTIFNLRYFDVANCQAIEGAYFTNGYYLVEFIIVLWVACLSIARYKKADIYEKRRILFVSLGIELFLMSFFITGFLNSFMVNAGFINDYVSFKIEQYGLFGMTFFMGMVAYLIVKFKAFNIKLLGTQALVVSLAVVVGSQFAFIQNNTNKILTAISLVMVIVFGWILVRSVKKEIKQKEALARANKSLALVNAKLEKIDATKTDFINIASHQLHKVPTPIKGYLSLLLEGSYGKIPEEQKRVLENINSANNRQIDLVDDLLNVSRMESGKVNLDFKKQHLEDICQKVYDTTLPDAEEKGLKFSYKKPKDVLPELILDSGKIFEAIFNFVDNAIKYTSKGKVDLVVEFDPKSRYKLQDEDDKYKASISSSVVRVTVTDTGAGIAEENVPYLFAKFSRKDTANLNTEGTGLGLYVVKLMIEAHGGRTWAESAGEGKGSQFIIEIPTKQPKNIVVK